MTVQTSDDLKLVQRLAEGRQAILGELRKTIIGQDEVIDQLLIALFARGHCLIVGVPGLAKTLLVSTMAKILDLSFNRIQFTPDLMPSDITGTEVIQEDRTSRERTFRFIKGPIFSNLILADEINRTPPKTQAALLQAMQEHKVTVGGQTYPLEEPFYVLATQNPIEQEGTYPLPEAQLDRFFFQINIGYPQKTEEIEIVRQTTSGSPAATSRVLSGGDILALQEIVRRVPAADRILEYAVRLVSASRPVPSAGAGGSSDGAAGHAPDYVKRWVTWGAGPRASQTLILAAKARAVISGRMTVSEEDVRALAAPVLRHRLVLSFEAEAEGVKPDDLVRRLLETVHPNGT